MRRNFIPYWFSRCSFTVLIGLLAAGTPLHAEGLGWRLPGQAATPNAAPAKGWALPAASKRVTDAAARGVERPADRPIAPLFDAPTLITTGFAGHIYGRPVLPEDKRDAARLDPKYQFINLDGAVVTLGDIEGFGHAPNGDEVTRAPYDQLYAREIGQVFGAVLDDETHPNLYLSATSAFGLQIVGPDSDTDRLPDRLTKGDAKATWMAGQWGFAPQSGPGTIWRVDGLTGQVAVFANLTEGGKSNAAPGLGNLAYDAGHKQIFASDLATGMISRLNLRGEILETFDHGVTARSGDNLDPVAYDPALRVEITDPTFDALTPDTWGFAPAARRVWGLALRGDRLFYAVASGRADAPEVWSVALDPKTGAFGDARWELTLSDTLPNFEISDIGFAPDGALVLAQRSDRSPSFDYSAFAANDKAAVIRYVYESPEDNPDTPSVWEPAYNTYAVGFAGEETNGNGGLAFGPGYDEDGFLDFSQCRGTVWTTGENLRNEPSLKKQLLSGGNLRVDGAMAQPAALLHDENSPPWISYSSDFNNEYPKQDLFGQIGDVAVLGCDGSQLAGDKGIGGDGEGGSTCKGKSCALLACLRDPKQCKPKEVACAKTSVTLKCDPKTGVYVAEIKSQNLTQAKLDGLKLSDPSGKISALPQMVSNGQTQIPLAGLIPGQVGQIKLCSFDVKAAASGQPHDCCNSSVEFKIPAKACVKEIQ